MENIRQVMRALLPTRSHTSIPHDIPPTNSTSFVASPSGGERCRRSQSFPVERTRPACCFLRLAGNRSGTSPSHDILLSNSTSFVASPSGGERCRRDVGAPSPSPWSARVSRAVSCVSRETVLAPRPPMTSCSSTRRRLWRVLLGANDADETSALPVKLGRSGWESFRDAPLPVGAQLAYFGADRTGPFHPGAEIG